MIKKKPYGQYFTIDEVAEFMVSLIDIKDKTIKILEPACGTGVFLRYLQKRNYTNLSAYEIDDSLANEFSFVKHESFISSPIKEKFNVIIGNPPYIRWKNLEPELKDELRTNQLWNTYFNSLCDYLFIFILKSIKQLKDGGKLIFICSDYWLNTTHSQSLRNYMCNHGYFESIFLFKEAPLFEHVTASFLIFKYIKGKTNSDSITLFRYKQKGKPTLEDLISYDCFEKFTIASFKENERWTMEVDQVRNRLKIFEKKCISQLGLSKIGDVCDIGNGMVSGLDRAFNVTGLDEDYTEYERKYLIEVLKAKDLERFRSVGVSKYIFIKDKINLLDFEAKCPNFKQHLQPYIGKLGERYSYNKQISYWEFVFPRNLRLFERSEDKIFVPCKDRISKRGYFRFCFAEKNKYPLQDVTAIYKKDSCKESIYYILAFLNTPMVFEWLCCNGITKGEIVEFSEAPIASIPYRPINWESESERNVYNRIEREILLFLQDSNNTHIKNTNKLFDELFQFH